MVLGGGTLVVVVGYGQKAHFGQAMALGFGLSKVVDLLILVEDH